MFNAAKTAAIKSSQTISHDLKQNERYVEELEYNIRQKPQRDTSKKWGYAYCRKRRSISFESAVRLKALWPKAAA